MQEPDDNGRLPIHVAAVFGQPRILTYLIKILSKQLNSIPNLIQSSINNAQKSFDENKSDEIGNLNQFDSNMLQKPNSLLPDHSSPTKVLDEKQDTETLNIEAAANYLDFNHWTPLHHASCDDAVNNYQECIKILLENGADPMLLTQQGKTALDLAYVAGRSQILVDVLPKSLLIALLMRIDDIVPVEVRKQFMFENNKLKDITSKISGNNTNMTGNSKIKLSQSIRSRKGYSFMRHLADKMDASSDPSEAQWQKICNISKSENSNAMSIWRRILLNDNVELLEKLRNSMVWHPNRYDPDAKKIKHDLVSCKTGQTMFLDFESAQNISMKQMAELFNDCYENGTGLFSYVQTTYQDILKVHDFRTILQCMTGLITFKPLSTNKVTILKPMYKSLLFLSIICGRLRVAEQLIRMRQFDILPTSILITLILRKLHKEPEFPHHVSLFLSLVFFFNLFTIKKN